MSAVRIDAPELKGTTKPAGEAAKAHLIDLLDDGAVSARLLGRDKYGRPLVVLTVTEPGGDRVEVNRRMIEDGHAKAYTP